MNIDKKIIMGVRNKDADAKKELISLTRNHLVQTIYKRYIGLEEKEINDILQATYTYAFMNMDKLYYTIGETAEILGDFLNIDNRMWMIV